MPAKGKYKKIGLYLLYGAIAVCLFVTVLSFNDFGAIGEALSTVEWKYILIALALLAVYATTYPLTTCILAKARGLDVSFGKTYVISMTEHFFNGITPFATGGQPFQVYAFSKAKVSPSESTGLLLMNFIIFMLVTNTYAVCSLFFVRRFVHDWGMGAIAIVGFSMNFLVLLFMFSVGISKKLRNGLISLVNKLCKVKWIGKILEPRKESLFAYFENMQTAFRDLSRKKGAFFLCLLIKIVTMGAYYAITFYILKALHVYPAYSDLFFIICGTSFAITMVVFLPTPGSSGGAEFAFTAVFSSVAGITSSVAASGMLVWRLLSYYLMMLVSLLFYVGLEISFSVKSKRTMSAGNVETEQEAEGEKEAGNEEKSEEESP